jgi:hypothetical protein
MNLLTPMTYSTKFILHQFDVELHVSLLSDTSKRYVKAMLPDVMERFQKYKNINPNRRNFLSRHFVIGKLLQERGNDHEASYHLGMISRGIYQTSLHIWNIMYPKDEQCIENTNEKVDPEDEQCIENTNEKVVDEVQLSNNELQLSNNELQLSNNELQLSDMENKNENIKSNLSVNTSELENTTTSAEDMFENSTQSSDTSCTLVMNML